ncbi:MAG: glycosyl hydrolase family 57 [Chromatiales bacterium]
MDDLPEEIGGLPDLSGREARIRARQAAVADRPLHGETSNIDFGRVRAACAVALHMHQPLIPAGGEDLRSAPIISNLQYMMEHPDVGDNHNAPAFRSCYRRMGEIVPRLVEAGANPRVMLEYSGTLLCGLRRMGLDDVLDSLKRVTCDPAYWPHVEWLGAPWGHAVAPSTPVQDYRRHVQAFQQHFAAIFGLEALERVRGFSPSEMALPNHPDVAYELVRTLLECGYRWVLVQEHSVERPDDGRHPQRPHLPHRLVCTNAQGETAEIVAVIKTQGSDSKLVGQMQPWYEARGLSRQGLGGRQVPPLVTQIADGENGGVMMNEFPSKYEEVVREASWGEVPLMNVGEYLDHLEGMGLGFADFPAIQPLFHRRIWERMQPGDGPERLGAVIEALRREDGRFHMEGGSWTNDLSWVHGYDDVLSAMERASARFHEVMEREGISPADPRYRNALFHLLVSQTSCYRYWGQGLWTDYGLEICRRTSEILAHDFP